MSDEPSPAAQADAPVVAAIDALLAELEREHEWTAELRRDLERAERRCQRLLVSVESALHTLTPAGRSPYIIRILQLRNETRPLGRPARDPRRRAVLEFLAECPADSVTSAELRAHLRHLGLSDASGYLGGLMATLVAGGIVTRKRMGDYIVNRRHRVIEWYRFQAMRRPVPPST